MSLTDAKKLLQRIVNENRAAQDGLSVISHFESLTSDIDAAKATIEKLQKEQESLLKKNETISAVYEKAELKAHEIVNAAKHKSEHILQQANEELAHHDKDVEASKEHLKRVNAEIDGLGVIHKAKLAECAKVVKELEALEALKDAAKKALGL